jgi:hypothetical protein
MNLDSNRFNAIALMLIVLFLGAFLLIDRSIPANHYSVAITMPERSAHQSKDADNAASDDEDDDDDCTQDGDGSGSHWATPKGGGEDACLADDDDRADSFPI